ncbi:type II secretion system F family protein [uncultured Winogradskyella sp.]|uniref:type II secretion system F family protein n=1 Tax=uncultured Winogradskyella sp. TaxID=395353 RepID=UPI0030D9F0CE|tara:strand:- start:109171 stop:110304 length:1134 start_codon:yes stop_codon:yes gene_type:complete
MGFSLENIKQNEVPVKKESKSTSLLERDIVVLKKAFSNKIKEDFYTKLSVLLKAGISIKEALELIKDSRKNKNTAKVLKYLIDELVSGKNLSDAIKTHKDFSDYEYFSLKIGEETGTSAKIMEQLAAFYNRKNEQRKNLINALTYPCIILTTAVLVIIFMLQFVVPMFQDIFKQQNAELPKITKIIISISDFIKDYGWLLLVALLGLFLSKVILNKQDWFKKGKDLLISKIPFVGSFVELVYLSQFTQAVALLTASKVPIVKSVNLVKQMIDYYPLNFALNDTEDRLLKGETFSTSLNQHKLFDAEMIALIKVAEETNQTEFMFERLNVQYNARVEQRSKLLSTVIEPIIILLVGLFVGFILLSMYLPMFRLSSVLG